MAKVQAWAINGIIPIRKGRITTMVPICSIEGADSKQEAIQRYAETVGVAVPGSAGIEGTIMGIGRRPDIEERAERIAKLALADMRYQPSSKPTCPKCHLALVNWRGKYYCSICPEEREEG